MKRNQISRGLLCRSLFTILLTSLMLSGKPQEPNQSEFTGKAAFLNELTKNTPPKLVASQNRATGPINFSQTVEATIDFTDLYSNHAGNLNYTPTKIRFNFFLENIFRQYSMDGFYGLVLHYGYYPQAKRIVYILSRGTLDTKGDTLSSNDEVGFCPFPDGENGQNSDHYILLANVSGNPYKIINETQLNALKQDYRDSVLVDTSTVSTPNLVPIKNETGHPEMVYHSPQELFSFYEEYESNRNLFLYLANGAATSIGVTEKRHIPILIFGDDVSFFPLDNIDYPSNGLNFPYRNKALDIGRQCPPNCPGSTNSCLPDPSTN